MSVLALETILLPVNRSGVVVARIAVMNRTTLFYSVNATGVRATAFRLSTPEGIIFTIGGLTAGKTVWVIYKLMFI